MSARILLVEDDSLLRHAFRLLIEDSGYIVAEAASVSDAIASAKDVAPDLVLLDLGLPDGPGLDVARALRAHPGLELIPIIALTGRVGADEKAACLEAGCTSYLTKPIEGRLLLKRLGEFLSD